MPPEFPQAINGVEQRLDAVLAVLRRIEARLGERPPVPVGTVELREPAQPARRGGAR